MAKRKKPDRYQTDAALEAELRFSPQETALATLLAGERSNRITSIKSAEGAARAATVGVKASRDPLRKAYLQAGLTRQDANSEADTVLARLGAGADVFKAGIARERTNAKTRIGESQASALGGLEERLQQIALGAQAARSAADTRYASSKRDIGNQFVNLGREKGLFTALSVSRQKEAQRARNAEFKKVAAQIEAQDARQEDQQAATADLQEDRQAHDDAKPKKPRKPKLTTDQTQKRRDAVGEARSWIRRFKGQPRSRVTGYLVRGETLEDANGKKLKVPKVGELWVSVAADLEYDGHVSRANRAKLKRAGISASRSGWNVRPRAKSTKRPVGNRASGVAGAVGQGAQRFAR